ncbi:MAG: energy-coupling factor transporter transmembrane protein EcfT [Synergistaceae bacterium]|nr:energy-coupling factor transporter transmembrane protein EcfT [Synergistaceae bacterium]
MRFTDINTGQYISTGSFIHRLDPRAKLLSLLIIISAVFPSKTFWGVMIWTLILSALVSASKLSWRTVIKTSKPVFFLAVFTFVFNLGAGYFRNMSVTGSLLEALFTAFRLVILMMFAVMLPLTTSPLELADGIGLMLRPLERFRFPANECAMMIGMAIRFIPLLMQETDKIMRAQLSRGARLGQGNIFRRVKAFLPILIPLLIIIFRRADEIAVAMEARGYNGGKGRTRRKPLRWKIYDTLAVTVCAVSIGLFFWAGV